MSTLNPFVRFNDGKCKEAMNFYKDCLGGELDFMMAKDTPMAKDMPAEKQDSVMHSTLKKGAWMIVGSDMMREKATVGDNVGLSLECDSQGDLDTVFNNLAEGGEVFMKPEDTFWGAYFGVVTDKYGVEWMLNYQKTPIK